MGAAAPGLHVREIPGADQGCDFSFLKAR